MANDVRAFAPSTGLLRSSLGDDTVLYDPVAEAVHIVGPLGSWLMGMAGPTNVDDVVDDLVDATGASRAATEAELVDAIGLLRSRRLVDHDRTGPPRPGPWPGSSLPSGGRPTGDVYAVLDQRIAFRSSSTELLATIDAALGGGRPGEPTIVLDAEPDVGGGVTVTAADVWPFPDREGLFRQLVTVLNEYAARSDTSVVLHAGAVRTPDGRVLLLVGFADAGKSTLTAALVQRGCDYLGDESIGVRADDLAAIPYPKPFTLDDSSRTLLGLSSITAPNVRASDVRADVVCPTAEDLTVDEIVLPVFRPGSGAAAATGLEPAQAVRALLENTLNLHRCGQDGLDTLCRLAAGVPVTYIEHGDTIALADELIEGRLRPEPGTFMWGRSEVDDVRPVGTSGVVIEPLHLDGRACAIVRHGQGSVTLFDELAAVLWTRLDGSAALSDLVAHAASELGAGADAWSVVVGRVGAMVDRGLVDGFEPSMPSVEPDGRTPEVAGDSPAWLLAPPGTAGEQESWGEPWSDLPFRTLWWDRVVVATDSAAVRDELLRAVEADAAVEVPSGDPDPAWSALDLIEFRNAPGRSAGGVLRVGCRQLTHVRAGDEVAEVATMLAAMCSGPHCTASEPIAPVWVRSVGSAAAVFVGMLPATHRPTSSDGWSRRSGLRVAEGHTVLVPDAARVVSWLRNGAAPDAVVAVWNAFDVAGIGVAGAISTADGWARLAEALAPAWGPSESYLRHVVAGGRASLVTGDTAEVVDRLTLDVSTDRPHRSAAVPTATPATANRSLESHERQRFEQRLAAFGDVGVADRSAKVDARRIVTDRPLLRAAFGRGSSRQDNPPTPDELRTGFVELGLEPDAAAEAAVVAAAAGAFYVGDERTTATEWRRKVYVSGIAPELWRSVAPGWPDVLAVHVDPGPSWLAWKFGSARPNMVQRAIDVPFLAGASTVAAASDPVLADLPGPWADAVRALVDRIGVSGNDRPRADDALTVEEGGRRSIDLAVRRAPTANGPLDAELRWLTAVAGHDDRAAGELIDFVGRFHLANVIFGLDGAGAPFVNLYVSENQR